MNPIGAPQPLPIYTQPTRQNVDNFTSPYKQLGPNIRDFVKANLRSPGFGPKFRDFLHAQLGGLPGRPGMPELEIPQTPTPPGPQAPNPDNLVGRFRTPDLPIYTRE